MNKLWTAEFKMISSICQSAKIEVKENASASLSSSITAQQNVHPTLFLCWFSNTSLFLLPLTTTFVFLFNHMKASRVPFANDFEIFLYKTQDTDRLLPLLSLDITIINYMIKRQFLPDCQRPFSKLKNYEIRL